MTEPAEPAKVHCPFCFMRMIPRPRAWQCERHNLSFLRCPECGNPLKGEPTAQWCARCRKWFNERFEEL
jgi:hypothetical protein